MLGCLAVTGLPSWIWTPFADWVPNWSEPLIVLGVGFPVGIGLRFLLDLGCPTCVNAWLLFTLLHIANLTSLLSSLREILENLYCLSKRGVAVHPKMDQLLPIIAALGWSMLGLVRCRPRQLSGYPEEVGGLPPAQDIEIWKHNGPDLDDLLAGQDEYC
ncbi:unnamed protein product [Prunus armeniaca]